MSKRADLFYGRLSLTQHFLGATGGATAIEFAFVLPVFLLLLFGIICYGAYFWRAHDVQQMANDAARSSIAGLDANERADIARQSVQNHLADMGSLNAAKTKVRVAERGDDITVTVSYDATGSAFWQVIDILPMPSSVIDRSATATLGGF